MDQAAQILAQAVEDLTMAPMNKAGKDPVQTLRHEVVHRTKRYRVYTYGGQVVRIDNINPTAGEKVVYRRIAMNGRIATAIKAQLRASFHSEAT